MGEPSVQLIESNVQHNTEDIRDLKERVGKVESDVVVLKTNHQLSQHTMSNVMDSVNELKVSFKSFDEKMDKEKEDQQKKEIQRLEDFKESVNKGIWKIIFFIACGFIALYFGF